MPFGRHVVLRAVDDRVLALDSEHRRAFAVTMRRIGREHGLFGFGLADTHGHAILVGDTEPVRFVHDIRPALARVLGFPLAPAAVRIIRDVWHAENLLAYVHRQDEHHEVHADPRREGTSLQDLCGLRPAGVWLAARVRKHLPRVTQEDLLRQWAIPTLDEALALEHLADAGAAAIGVARLTGREAEVVKARRACVHAAVDIPTVRLAEALAIAPRTVRELRAEPADPLYVRAVRLQMGLRQVVKVANDGAFGSKVEPSAGARAVASVP
jgi:hypothetical protein